MPVPVGAETFTALRLFARPIDCTISGRAVFPGVLRVLVGFTRQSVFGIDRGLKSPYPEAKY
jgi:hypothetical protein